MIFDRKCSLSTIFIKRICASQCARVDAWDVDRPFGAGVEDAVVLAILYAVAAIEDSELLILQQQLFVLRLSLVHRDIRYALYRQHYLEERDIVHRVSELNDRYMRRQAQMELDFILESLLDADFSGFRIYRRYLIALIVV